MHSVYREILVKNPPSVRRPKDTMERKQERVE